MQTKLVKLRRGGGGGGGGAGRHDMPYPQAQKVIKAQGYKLMSLSNKLLLLLLLTEYCPGDNILEIASVLII